MAAALPLKRPVKVGELVRRRLRELKRTPRELADAVQVSEIYIADLVAGRRRPPAPGRMDVYAPMTKFLKLHRNDSPPARRPSGTARPRASSGRIRRSGSNSLPFVSTRPGLVCSRGGWPARMV